MAEVLKVLGQVSPAANALTQLYVVPAATSVTASTLSICNGNSSSVTYRVSVQKAGDTDNIKQYLFYDSTLSKNNSFFATLGITLAAGDKVMVYASNTNVAFQLFGVELS